MTGISPRCSASFGKISSPALLARSFSTRPVARLRTSGSLMPEISCSAVTARYQSSSVFSSLNSAIDSR
jgi:hypothetical protein